MASKEADFTPVVQHTHEFYIVAPNNDRVATADIQWRNGVCWLTNVWTHHEYRGRDFASKVVAHALANHETVDVYLMVHPYTDMPLSESQLKSWYREFGFVEIAGAPGMMMRPYDKRFS